jgi:hypothetical protein
MRSIGDNYRMNRRDLLKMSAYLAGAACADSAFCALAVHAQRPGHVCFDLPPRLVNDPRGRERRLIERVPCVQRGT